MPKKSWWAKQVLNAALVGSVVYIGGGFYGEKLDRDSRRIVLEVDPDVRLSAPLASLSAQDRQQVDCLAENAYFEARGEGKVGMAAVTNVVFNRMHAAGPFFPATACDVITQCNPRSGVCQFSWVNDGLPHIMRDTGARDVAYDVAMYFWTHQDRPIDMTDGATSYHATYVSPKWTRLKETIQIGMHKFFKPKGE